MRLVILNHDQGTTLILGINIKQWMFNVPFFGAYLIRKYYGPTFNYKAKGVTVSK